MMKQKSFLLNSYLVYVVIKGSGQNPARIARGIVHHSLFSEAGVGKTASPFLLYASIQSNHFCMDLCCSFSQRGSAWSQSIKTYCVLFPKINPPVNNLLLQSSLAFIPRTEYYKGIECVYCSMVPSSEGAYSVV